MLTGCALTACVTAALLLTGGQGLRFVMGAHSSVMRTADAHNQGLPAALTAPVSQGAAFARQDIPVGPLFQAYYASSAGAARLGVAVTATMPVAGGWLQFFTAGALFVPGRSPVVSSHWTAQAGDSKAAAMSDALHAAIEQAAHDATGAVASLPLLDMLTHAGSEAPIGGSSIFSYANLRTAIQADQPVPAPAWYAPNRPLGSAGAFVPEATRHGVVLGHLVPLAFWNVMTQPATAPDGWSADFGAPLTEALPVTALVGGAIHTLLVQVFQHAALIVDTNVMPQAPHPLAIGIDYLKTFGPPSILVAADTPAWVTDDTQIHQEPGLSSPVQVELGPGYPLLLASGARWMRGTLWYEAMWSSPRSSATGWVPANAVSFAAPTSGPASAGIEVLDSGLANYLTGLGSHVGVVVYDLTHHVYYSRNPTSIFISASSVKVPIMLTLLAQTEAQGREPDSYEMYLLTTMIENSDNDSAQALYEEIGDAPGLSAGMQGFGVSGLHAAPGTWGWSHITPSAMAQLLTLLWTGSILTASDRAIALELMESVESDQQFGVGDTAPAGGTVALKNGWVTGPDNLWDVNTSGIVTTPSETYLITVYTSGNATYQQGVDILETICGAVSADLG